MKRFKMLGVAALLALLVFAVGCGGPAAENEPKDEPPETRVITHAMGETEIPANPQRVIDLVGILDHMVALDLRVIASPSAISWAGFDFAPYLVELHKEPITAVGDGWDFSLEQILSLEPDVILMYEGMEAYEELSKIAPTIVLSYEWGNLHEGLQELGKVFGRENKAEEVLKRYEEKAALARDQLSQSIGDEEVMFLRISDKFYRVYGRIDNQVPRLLYDDLGLTFMQEFPIDEWKQDLTLEGLTVYNPGHIFVETNAGEGPERLLKELEASNVWNSLQAVQAGNIYNGDGFIYYAQGTIGSSILIDQILEDMLGN
ncbi:MAG: ABC transporter substrate-binding protein [Bacillota bacterium]|nr:ABC transporter substrate-binding protein [Bacillota bacterium]MDW7684912.1 ABC transporter substrate-binding protein [Bacillota bacterium]